MARRSAKKNSKFNKIVTLVFAIVTIVLLIIITLSVFIQKKHLEEIRKRCTASATGVCYEVSSKVKTRTVHKKRRNGSKSFKTQEYYTEYTSHIRYNADGKDYDTSLASEHAPRLKEGGSITVFYDPDDPSVCYVP